MEHKPNQSQTPKIISWKATNVWRVKRYIYSTTAYVQVTKISTHRCYL